MLKCLTENEFQQAIAGRRLSRQTINIAHGVLVEGMQQSDFVKKYCITKGAVWQAVQRVWAAPGEKL